MRLPPTLPELAVVRVLTAGGPYAVGERLSLAFGSPGIGRLASHESLEDVQPKPLPAGALVPESISVTVVRAADPYAAGDVLTLSFIDPRVARIHPATPNVSSRTAAQAEPPNAERSPAAELILAPPPLETHAPEHSAATPPVREARGVRVQLLWSPERARRFVQVVDKLFTVDRLGWYRHAFAMRLLVPDLITTGDPLADGEVARHLQALRAAVVETLGRPLLEAFMPNFSVTSNWLAQLDSPSLARALAALRDVLLPRLEDVTQLARVDLDPAATVGAIERREFLQVSGGSIEAFLPVLVPCVSPSSALTEALGEYRRMLLEAFAQTAQSAEAVRLNAMAQPNHPLDDRLWQLVGIVGESLDGLAVA